MKFGNEFTSQMVQEYQGAYMDYNSLKKILKEIMLLRQNRTSPPSAALGHWGSLKRRLDAYRAFTALHNTFKGSPKNKTNKYEDEVILVDNEVTNGNSCYHTRFMRLSDNGGINEQMFFRRLDDEFNKVVKFYKEKVEDVKGEADELRKEMDALIELRVIADTPNYAENINFEGAKAGREPRSSSNHASVKGGNKPGCMDAIQEIEMSTEEAFEDEPTTPILQSHKPVVGFRPASLDVSDHVNITVDQDTPLSMLQNIISKWEPNISFSKYELRQAEEKLRQAFIDFCQQLQLLKSYRFLNRLAFSKIMKKYDKITSRSASESYLKMVAQSYLGTSDEVNKLIKRLEASFIKNFANGNHRKGKNSLQQVAHKKEIRRMSTFFLETTGSVAMRSFFRITSLKLADLLTAYALWVLQSYLTDVWNYSFTRAAGILNVWGGICMVLPTFLLFLVDEFLGNYLMLVITSIAYSSGMVFISISTPSYSCPKSCSSKEEMCEEPYCKIGHTKRVLFFTGMALVAVGVSGFQVSLSDFLNEQKDDNEGENETTHKWRRRCGVMLVGIVCGIVALLLSSIDPWSLHFGIPTICMVAATLLFLSGRGTYAKVNPQGSPLKNICRVFVACIFKINVPFPLDEHLYKYDDMRNQSFSRTHFLRFLEKAAIDTNPEDQVKNKWKLCSVAEVEEAKIAVRMVPMWMTFITCAIVSSVGNTYLQEQAEDLNPNIGIVPVPLEILLFLFIIARLPLDKLAFLFLKSRNKIFPRSKKDAYIAGIGMSMICAILCCIAAALLETRRLRLSKNHDHSDGDEFPMHIYWLFVPIILLAGSDSFFENSSIAFYKHQAPHSMKRYLFFFTQGVTGLGYMLGTVLVYVVGQISETIGDSNWFQSTIDESQLDKYYWMLAALSSVNLLVFVLVASCYHYKPKDHVEETGVPSINEKYGK